MVKQNTWAPVTFPIIRLSCYRIPVLFFRRLVSLAQVHLDNQEKIISVVQNKIKESEIVITTGVEANINRST